MALSDYERRVLAEIEVELRAEIAPRRRLRNVFVIAACLLVVAAAEGYDDYRLVFNTGAGVGQTVFHAHLHLLAGRSMTWPPG